MQLRRWMIKCLTRNNFLLLKVLMTYPWASGSYQQCLTPTYLYNAQNETGIKTINFSVKRNYRNTFLGSMIISRLFCVKGCRGQKKKEFYFCLFWKPVRLEKVTFLPSHWIRNCLTPASCFRLNGRRSLCPKNNTVYAAYNCKRQGIKKKRIGEESAFVPANTPSSLHNYVVIRSCTEVKLVGHTSLLSRSLAYRDPLESVQHCFLMQCPRLHGNFPRPKKKNIKEGQDMYASISEENVESTTRKHNSLRNRVGAGVQGGRPTNEQKMRGSSISRVAVACNPRAPDSVMEMSFHPPRFVPPRALQLLRRRAHRVIDPKTNDRFAGSPKK